MNRFSHRKAGWQIFEINKRRRTDGKNFDTNGEIGQSKKFDLPVVTFTASKADKANDDERIKSKVVNINSSGDDTALVDSLMKHSESLVDVNACNLIAFSGGIDSSLTAKLVHETFHNMSNTSRTDNQFESVDDSDLSSRKGSVTAVIGISPSLAKRQLKLAQSIASSIQIPLTEVLTSEGTNETYIENNGKACFVCKTHLYQALEAVAKNAKDISQSIKEGNVSQDVILYNGTNADDTQDPTRLGLIAAQEFSVKSPLIHITKEEVRRAARHLGLENWDYAASPCLRSRLELGVEATKNHLQAVQLAEEYIRQELKLGTDVNFRVRMLTKQRAMLELDVRWLVQWNELSSSAIQVDDFIRDEEDDCIDNNEVRSAKVLDFLKHRGVEEYFQKLGFYGGLGIRAFKSGSVANLLGKNIHHMSKTSIEAMMP